VVLKELTFCFKSGGDGLGGVDVALTTVYDWYITQSKRDNTTSKNVDDISSLVPISSD